MLPTKANLTIQTDILPTQNIGLIDQNQPQIYSLLGNSNSPNSMKKPRRKRLTNFGGTNLVMVNPQITRTSAGINFTTHHQHQRSSSLPESMSSAIGTRFINDQRLPLRLYLDPNTCDANNNIPTIAMSVNSTFPAQVMCASPVNHTKSQLVGVNQPLDNTMNERIVSISSLQQNKLFMLADQGSQLSHSPSVPPVKFKRNYSKRQNLPASVEQQQTSACPTTFAQPNVSNSLPSIIPASVIGMSAKSEEQPFPLDIPTTSSYVPLTPPGSIKSPPANTVNELSMIPVQRSLLPFSATNVAEMNPISNQYCPSPWLSYPRRTIPDSSYHLHRFLTATPTQYCVIPSNLIPTNILPMAYSSVLSRTTVPNPDMKDESRRHEQSTQKSKTKESFGCKPLTTNISGHKKREHKKSSIKNIHTKKQLKRITRKNQLAVLKYMVQKRKQQKQRSISTPQVTPESVPIPVEKPKEMETNLLDIIAPSLKISFDPTQKIESIVLYYHRRRKPDLTSENPSKLLNNMNNRLDLLVEAVDYLETQQSHLNLKSCSNQ